MRTQVPSVSTSVWAGRCWFDSAKVGSGKIVRLQMHQARSEVKVKAAATRLKGVTVHPPLPMDDRDDVFYSRRLHPCCLHRYGLSRATRASLDEPSTAIWP